MTPHEKGLASWRARDERNRAARARIDDAMVRKTVRGLPMDRRPLHVRAMEARRAECR